MATFLGIPVQTLYQWRRKGFGPKGTKVGKYVRYEPDGVREWFKSLGES
ncbi:helix-turn-helix domain-containing protein [Kutzneria kofuensis]|uniref:Putative DNA-binding transcriptional regulator AlpA n=1 Tax=Kutzneria kofuensis TaxID=103725 RepID=A0A7W9NGB6_9PSEU|nr:putative DNA-binding transcriptional regulator AlpA [Kutzneria kofuensis]